MSSFDFHTKTISIKSLELTATDNPSVQFKDHEVVITAKRGAEQIRIVAHIPDVEESIKQLQAKVIQPVAVTTVKTPKSSTKKENHPLKGKILPSTDRRSGENNHFSKLTIAKVKEIRELSNDSDIMNAYGSRGNFCLEIGKAYGIHPTTVHNIINRISWKHV